MNSSTEKISRRQADVIGDTLLAAPLAAQREARKAIELQRLLTRAPRRFPAVLFALAALIGARPA